MVWRPKGGGGRSRSLPIPASSMGATPGGLCAAPGRGRASSGRRGLGRRRNDATTDSWALRLARQSFFPNRRPSPCAPATPVAPRSPGPRRHRAPRVRRRGAAGVGSQRVPGPALFLRPRQNRRGGASAARSITTHERLRVWIRRVVSRARGTPHGGPRAASPPLCTLSLCEIRDTVPYHTIVRIVCLFANVIFTRSHIVFVT